MALLDDNHWQGLHVLLCFDPAALSSTASQCYRGHCTAMHVLPLHKHNMPAQSSDRSNQVVQQTSSSVQQCLLFHRHCCASLCLTFVPHLQVGDGTFDFQPPPDESKRLIASQYKVPSLMVRFSNDGIDETPELLQSLQMQGSSGAIPTVNEIAD